MFGYLKEKNNVLLAVSKVFLAFSKEESELTSYSFLVIRTLFDQYETSCADKNVLYG
jgi:hypothetical protein